MTGRYHRGISSSFVKIPVGKVSRKICFADKDKSEYEGERTDESEQDDSQSRRSDRNGDRVSVCCI